MSERSILAGLEAPTRIAPSHWVGRYEDLYGRLLARLRAEPIAIEGVLTYPLAQLNTEAADDFGVGLVSAWAATGDVLSFYLARIAAEGYLDTAVQPDSVRELTRAIGFETRQAVSARGYLAYTVRDTSGKGKAQPATRPPASPVVTIPAGPLTLVRSLPRHNEAPVYFQPDAQIEARPEWNAIPPVQTRESVPGELSRGQTQLRLAGTRIRVARGGVLLLRASEKVQSSKVRHEFVVEVVAAESEPRSKTTVVTWRAPLPIPPGVSLALEEVLTFDQKASLFGYNAQPFTKMPSALQWARGTHRGGICRLLPTGADGSAEGLPSKWWVSADESIAPAEPHDLLVVGDDLLCGTGRGLFRSTNGGADWTEVQVGATSKLEVFALAADGEGDVWLGGSSARVYRSKDSGRTWEAVNGQLLGEVYEEQEKPPSWATLVLRWIVRVLTTDVVELIRWLWDWIRRVIGRPFAWLLGRDARRLRRSARDQIETRTSGGGQHPPSKAPVAATTGPDPAGNGGGEPPAGNPTPIDVTPGVVRKTLPKTVVRSLTPVALPTEKGSLAGMLMGSDTGVFFMATGSLDWQSLNDGLGGAPAGSPLSPCSVRTLLQTDGVVPDVYAGTDRGLWKLAGTTSSWTEVPLPHPRCVVNDMVIGPAGDLWLATRDGVLRHDWHRWEEANEGFLQTPSVSSITVDRDGAIWIGTELGAFRRTDDGWESFDDQRIPILSMDAEAGARLVDGEPLPSTLLKVLRKHGYDVADPASPVTHLGHDLWWLPGARVASPAESAPDIGALTAYLFDTGTGGRVQLFGISASPPSKVAAVVDLNSTIVAAGGDPVLVSREWPDFEIQDGQVDASRVLKGVAAKSTIALVPGTADAPGRAWTLNSVSTVALSKFSKSGTVTRLSISPSESEALLDLRGTTVFAQSRRLHPAARTTSGGRPVEGRELVFEGAVPLTDDDHLVAVTGKAPSAFIPEVGGLIVYRPDSADAPAHRELTLSNVFDIAVDGTTVYVASDSGRVWSRELSSDANADARLWDRLETGLPVKSRVTAITARDGVAYCGTDGAGVFTRPRADDAGVRAEDEAHSVGWVRAGSGQYPRGITDLVLMGSRLVAATEVGSVHQLDLDAASSAWVEISSDLPAGRVSALAVHRDRLYAAISGAGVFCRPPSGLWTAASTGLEQLDVHTLFEADDVLLAGTAGAGVFRRTANGAWAKVGPSSSGPRNVGAVCIHDRVVWASEVGGATYRIEEGTTGWRRCAAEVSNDVRSIVGTIEGIWVGAARRTGLRVHPRHEPMWIGPTLVTTLSRIVPANLDEGVIPAPLEEAMKTVQRPLSSEATLRTVDRGRVWRIRDGDSLYVVLARKQPLPQRGAARRRVIHEGLVFEAELLEVDEATIPSGSSADPSWRFGGRWDGKLVAGRAQVMWEAAASTNHRVGAIARVSGARWTPDSQRTVFTLSEPLARPFDAATTTVSANVVRATEGQSFVNEVLGSGDAGTPGQEFLLQHPLTDVVDPISGLLRSTLDVTVVGGSPAVSPFDGIHPPGRLQVTPDGVRWRRVEDLRQCGPTDQVFIVQTTADGRTRIRFGDGVHGARLPTGRDNVLASYRSGGGSRGNVPTGALVTFLKRPPDVTAVSNPIPSVGGIDAQRPLLTRTVAPETVQTHGRIVTLGDYQSFASTFGGIGVAEAVELAGGGRRRVHVSASDTLGASIEESPELRGALVRAMDAVRSDNTPLSVGGYHPIPFDVTIAAALDDDGEAGEVQAAIDQTLQDSFSVRSRGFGRSVALSEVEAAVRSIGGVASIHVVSINLAGRNHPRSDHIPARQARWDPLTGSVSPPDAVIYSASSRLNVRWEANER